MRSPGELSGAWRCTYMMFPNYDIDFEFIARVVRLKDEPREIADFDSGMLCMQTVSMDTHFSSESL